VHFVNDTVRLSYKHYKQGNLCDVQSHVFCQLEVVELRAFVAQ